MTLKQIKSVITKDELKEMSIILTAESIEAGRMVDKYGSPEENRSLEEEAERLLKDRKYT